MLTAARNHQSIQEEYNTLFTTEQVRDEDRAYRWHARNVLRLLQGGGSVLDIACGGGYFLRELKREGRGAALNLFGCDISNKALAIAGRECPQAKYLLGVAEHMPFQSASFDLLTCLGSLEHFLDIPSALREMIRLAKPQGYFYILVPNQYWYKDIASVLMKGDKKDRNQTQERFASLGEWKETLESGGLKVTEIIKYNGIAKNPVKQWLKDLLIPLPFSYHFLFICQAKNG